MKLFKQYANVHRVKPSYNEGLLQERAWFNLFKTHVGKYVVLHDTRDRKETALLGEVYQLYKHHVIIRRKMYTGKGEFRCYLNESVSYSSLICEECRVVVLSEV